MQIRFRDDFQQGRAGPIQINATLAGKSVVNGFAGILFEMSASDPHAHGLPAGRVEPEQTGTDDRMCKLADLITLGQIGIKVVFSLEDAGFVDRGVDRQTEHYRHAYSRFIQYRQRARKSQIHRRRMAVGRRTKCC